MIMGQSHPQNQVLALVNWVITSLVRQTLWGRRRESGSRDWAITSQTIMSCTASKALRGHTIGTTIGYRKGTHTLPQTLSGRKEGGRVWLARLRDNFYTDYWSLHS